MDHYEALGVPHGADPAEIRRAYLQLARRHHPDVSGTAATPAVERMTRINQAYEVLGDPARRSDYDEALRNGAVPGVAPRTSGSRGRPWMPRQGDDGWMQDFASWRDEVDALPPDEPSGPLPRHRGLITVLPVVLFGLAVLSGVLGLILLKPGLEALAAVFFILSVALFVTLPMFAMVTQRHRD
ncbi:MAG TPA: J domain-containing protein [Acidimicrobiales bacterium]